MTYQPTEGYVENDSFTIEVGDGKARNDENTATEVMIQMVY